MEKVEKISEGLRFDQERGVLSFKDVRYLLIRPETMIQLRRELVKALGDKASDAFERGGFEGGSLSSKTYKEKFGLSNEEVAQYMCEMGSQLGWGKFDLVELSEDRLVVDVHNSAFAEAHGPSSEPVCHMVRGVLTGLGNTVLESEVKSQETSCIAKGDDVCRFIVTKEG